MHVLASFWGVLTAAHKRRLRRTLLLMLAGAAAELISIGALLPLLTLLVNPGPMSEAIAERLKFIPAEPVVVAAIIFTMAAFASAATRFALVRSMSRLALDVAHELAAGIFGRMLRQPYSDHVRGNSSDVLVGIERVQLAVFGFLVPIMRGGVAAFIALSILTLLLFVDAATTILAALFLTCLYVSISLALRQRLDRDSISIAAMGKARIKAVQEALGAMRDIILDRSQPLFEAEFRRLDWRFREAQSATQIIATGPRFAIEAMAVAVLTLMLVLSSFRAGGIAASLPVIGMLALAAQRLLPLLHEIFTGWSLAVGNLQPLREVIALAHVPVADEDGGSKPKRNQDAIRFKREIAVDRVGFCYGQHGFMLENISLTISRGNWLGITGATGCGKSTLLDLLMGLLEPRNGTIRVDGRPLDSATRPSWRRQIAHVPQAVHLFDDTIATNIAFAVPQQEVSIDAIRAAAAAACIDDFIDSLPEGYQTRVGERGILLSGGQRQRLGIARALYRRAPVLILDEATNALDEQTEDRILQSLADRPELTLIAVSHRAATLSRCHSIINLEGGILLAAKTGRSAIEGHKVRAAE